MAVDQLPGEVREFAGYLNKLMTKLDQGGGWCAVFWRRDPDGMRACLDGLEVPPWDVVEALMHDLHTAYGPAVAAQETARARALHGASLAAYDALPGGRDALGDRFDVMLREQRYAAERTAELDRRLRTATTREEAESLRLDLAWAHDDHERATARCAELRARMENLDRRAPHLPVRGATRFPDDPARDFSRAPEAEGRAPEAATPGGRTGRTYAGPEGAVPAGPRDGMPTDRTDDRRAHDPYAAPGVGYDAHTVGRDTQAQAQGHEVAFDAHDPAHDAADPEVEAVTSKKRAKRRPRGGARFAGAVEAEEVPVVVPESAPAQAAAPQARARRGARYAGVTEEAAPPQRPERPARQALDDEARREVAGTVERLLRLRKEGRSGEAHALLVEVAHWPAARFPLLAADMHRAGLGADWATLLWEAASLPVDRLVAVVDALNAVGRVTDGEQMLRQGVGRPSEEIGEAVLGLAEEGREWQARALLDAYVRVRTPEEAARVAEAHPQRLTRMVVEAARAVSEDRHRDVAHALRVAGLA
ncbi:hypothetical protein [Streptomyces neyagawaensis]|uniref:hypothetical protein n=1 Tax=Streptomyces neyagawaensis TaxID=42238 RepID=UPI0006E1F84A|nr:hypothetical protein [Streptomyces neyagawaensis]MCL6732115.1 hypothetical protein [Streptomyces neyagawaensis]MDE1682390.1 hypothetical protein [Streptomyces neyagawaensis]